MTTLVCNCNRTMPIDGPALARAVAAAPGTVDTAGMAQVHTTLCRREAPAFQRAAKAASAGGPPLVVACTQEQRLFVELNEATEGAASVAERPIRFVNLRETGGWGREAAQATPKWAALLAAAQLPDPPPVPTVAYRSAGRVLVIGTAEDAERAAAPLADTLEVSVLALPGGADALGQATRWPVHRGRLLRLAGWLGAFDVAWEEGNPIALDLCTRCNACIAACPEGAIDFSYQVDLERCTGHRACVRACEAAGAIDFTRPAERREARFDMVLDLRNEPGFASQPAPLGYAHAGRGEAALAAALHTLRGLVGQFDKPVFLRHDAKLCAHSRSERIGCSACIEVCSTRAIVSDASLKGKAPGRGLRTAPGGKGAPAVAAPLAGGVRVESALCVGCGACSTVCPTGAMGFAYPDAVATGARFRTLLGAYLGAGGRAPALLLHSQQRGARLIDALGRAASVDAGTHGVPARVLPVALWHTASVGLELWLAAIAQGACNVWLLVTDEEAPGYLEALQAQMEQAQAIVSGLGYAGKHFEMIRLRDDRDLPQLDAALRAAPAQGVARPAAFSPAQAKRGSLELALDHLLAQAPAPLPEAVALPSAGAALGSLRIDTEACTLCLACVSACPPGALADNPEAPQLRFTEKLCVQCGLCASTCPEDAITLQPRLWLAQGGQARKQRRVLHEMAPYACVRCGKPFGTLKAIEAMVARLAGHSAFQGRAAERLRMCGDCRVIDLHTDAGELRITDV